MARARRRALAAALGLALDAPDGRVRRPVHAGRHRADRARAARAAGRARELRPRLGDPRAARVPRLEHDPPAAGSAQRDAPSRWRRASSATCSATTRATSSAKPASRWSAASSASGCSARPARSWLPTAEGGSTASAWAPADRDLPPSDRIAHLLLALRTDEEGFATVANHAFSGAPWRLRRRIRKEQRPALGRCGEGGALTMAWNVVIAGGGFGGLYAARRLERVLPRHSARITVLSDTNFLLYTPLLPGAAAGTLEPRHVVVPLREELDWADVQLGRVLGARRGRERAALVHPRRPRGAHALRPARPRARLGLAHAADPGARRARGRASRRSPMRSRCATARCSTSRSPSRSTTPRSGAST